MIGAAHLDGRGRRPGAGLRRAEVRRARPARPARSSPPAASASTRSAARSQHANVNLPTGILYGPDKSLHHAGRRAAHRRRRVPAADRRLPRRQAGAPRRRSARSSTASRTTRSRPGSSTSARIILAIQRQPGTNTVEVAQRGQAAAADVRAAAAGRASSSGILFDRSMSIHESVNDVKFTLLLTLVLVVLVIFLFLRNLSATMIPSLAMPMSIVGTLRRHVPARLHARQPLADGAHALGRLRRRRRHRHAREHRPPHGDGQDAVPGGARRLARDRLHHRLDDAVAGGGVHPGAVHGRHRRPAVPRVRGHDRPAPC